MIKHKFVPAQLSGFMPASRSDDRLGDRRPRRSETEQRQGRSAPQGRTGGHAGLRKEKIDPWFLKPYEPAASSDATPEPQSAKQTASAKPQKKAALLGGTPKR